MNMVGVDELLTELGNALDRQAGTANDGVCVRVTHAHIKIPAEFRIDRSGKVIGALPIGRLATGFMRPLGLIRATFEERVDQ